MFLVQRRHGDFLSSVAIIISNTIVMRQEVVFHVYHKWKFTRWITHDAGGLQSLYRVAAENS